MADDGITGFDDEGEQIGDGVGFAGGKDELADLGFGDEGELLKIDLDDVEETDESNLSNEDDSVG